MTIEEKVSNIILETMKEQTDFCKKTALGNKATLAEQKAILDKAVQAILALIKPMSRERLTEIIQKKHIYVDGVCDTDCFVVVPLQALADAILAKWEKGLK